MLPKSLLDDLAPCRGRASNPPYLAMTSTYLPPPFFLPPLGPLRGVAAPIKSSILLALLMLVAGRLGGAEGGPPRLAAEADRAIGGIADPPGGASMGGVPEPSGGAGVDPVRAGGADDAGPGGGGLGVPRGGGGVAVFGALSSAPAALLTQRFCSGS